MLSEIVGAPEVRQVAGDEQSVIGIVRDIRLRGDGTERRERQRDDRQSMELHVR